MKTLLAIFFSIISIFSKNADPQIKGIILPHHDLAKSIFHDSLERLSKLENPSTIVILGTNHYYPSGPLFTTTKDVQTKYKLTEVLIDDNRISKEHSIQTLLPYLKQYFPNAEVLPIIIGSTYNLNSLNTTSKELIEIFPKDSLLYIASVDFSHNSTIEQGLLKNEESIDAISNFNYQKVLSYHDDHMDSPVAITMFMKTMENLNAKTWNTWVSSHGGLIINSPNLNGTSYVVGIFK